MSQSPLRNDQNIYIVKVNGDSEITTHLCDVLKTSQ